MHIRKCLKRREAAAEGRWNAHTRHRPTKSPWWGLVAGLLSPAKRAVLCAACRHTRDAPTDARITKGGITGVKDEAPWLDAGGDCPASRSAQLVRHAFNGAQWVLSVDRRLHGGRVAAHVHQDVRHSQPGHLRRRK